MISLACVNVVVQLHNTNILNVRMNRRRVARSAVVVQIAGKLVFKPSGATTLKENTNHSVQVFK